jgi:predicted lipid carrier protein YhbT
MPAWAGFGVRILPLPVVDRALQRLTKRIVDGHPESFRRMAPYASTTFLIEPTDLPIRFRIRLDGCAPIICQRRPARCSWDARIAGPILSLLALAHGALDGDALFFSREISIEGNTDAILALRNAIDAAEIDLPHEIAALLGPLGPVARHMADIAMPVMGRLFDSIAVSRGAQAT